MIRNTFTCLLSWPQEKLQIRRLARLASKRVAVKVSAARDSMTSLIVNVSKAQPVQWTCANFTTMCLWSWSIWNLHGCLKTVIGNLPIKKFMRCSTYIIKWSKLVFVIAMKEQKVPWGGQMKHTKAKPPETLNNGIERGRKACYIPTFGLFINYNWL